jgi:ketosteroid isomerase-like protein
MQRDQVETWVDRYERAWRTPGTDALAELFAEEASYSQGPYRESLHGLRAIGEMWEAERDGSDEVFTMESAVVAVDGDTAVVRIEVRYGDPVQEYRDLWIMQFDANGRCRRFEEWPYAPDAG